MNDLEYGDTRVGATFHFFAFLIRVWGFSDQGFHAALG